MGTAEGEDQARDRQHEYNVSPSGYFAYFNGVGNATGPAGDRSKGYYSFDTGAWHVVVINSNCNKITGTTNGADCAVSSPQYTPRAAAAAGSALTSADPFFGTLI